MDFGYVIKKTDDWFIVLVDINEYNSGYGVVSREEDPINLYDIDEVRAYCEANPDMVLTEHPLEERVKLEREKSTLERWLTAHDYIGTKIATGRSTIEDYAEEIAEMSAKAQRINEINALLGG